MASLYDVSEEAQNGLFEIWRHIAEDSVDLADRIDGELHQLFASLAECLVRGTLAGNSPGGLFSSFHCIRSWWYINPKRGRYESWRYCVAGEMSSVS